MSPVATIRVGERPPVRSTVRAIARLAEAGARSRLALDWTADAARERGDGRDRLGVLRLMADRIRRTVTYTPDEYGTEVVQAIEETLSDRRAGDCDDFAVAVLALARAAGLRGGIAVLYDVEGSPVHVLPIVEDPRTPDKWLGVELTRPLVFGEWPDTPAGSTWTIEALQPRLEGGVSGIFDFLGAAVSPVFAFLGLGSSLSTEETKAKEARKTAEAQARATYQQTRAAENIAKATVAQERYAEAQRTERLGTTLAFVREALPMFGLIAGGAILVSALAGRGR